MPGAARVGVVEFLNGVGKRVEKHAAKPEDAVGSDMQRLIEAGKLRRKNLRIPCKRVSHKFSSLSRVRNDETSVQCASSLSILPWECCCSSVRF